MSRARATEEANLAFTHTTLIYPNCTTCSHTISIKHVFIQHNLKTIRHLLTRSCHVLYWERNKTPRIWMENSKNCGRKYFYITTYIFFTLFQDFIGVYGAKYETLSTKTTFLSVRFDTCTRAAQHFAWFDTSKTCQRSHTTRDCMSCKYVERHTKLKL